MFRTVVIALLVTVTLVSCSSMKPLNFTSDKQVVSSPSEVRTPVQNIKEVKFLNDISTEAEPSRGNKAVVAENPAIKESAPDANTYLTRSSSVEKASNLQLKYAILLNTEVEQLQDNSLLEHIDEWYGTRYRYGGTTKNGIDCSAFVQAIYLSVFAVALPRTARDQYRSSRIVSATEMKTGDLVFFNTTGGISHVGIYLQNNKFIHASTSYGVTISDMFDPYYLRHFIGAGRIEKPEVKIK